MKPLCKFNDNHLDVDNEFTIELYLYDLTLIVEYDSLYQASCKDKDDKNSRYIISD